MADGWNYLELEGLITERLAACGVTARVLSAADLAGVDEASQITPALHVIYDGDKIVEMSAYGSARVAQGWLVVVAVRNARDQRAGTAARSEAGPLAQQVLGALMGWVPSPRWGACKKTNGPKPLFTAGFFYLPLRFEMEVVL